MRTVLIIILFLNTSLAWTQGRAQQGSIQFDELVHSFGIIAEKDGGVFHNFHFQNTGNTDVILTDIYTGCSCSAGAPADTVLSPGEESFIQVAYYPKNRPGTFVKSVRIDFMTDSTAFSRYLNIKGFVADEKASQIASSQEQASYSIRLAPLRIKVMALNDTLVTHRSEIIDFINAITYVIDADKFVNLKLTLTYHQSARKEWAEAYGRRIRRIVTQGLADRQYLPSPVGFETEIQATPDLKGGHLMEIELFNPKYTDHTLEDHRIVPFSTTGQNQEREILPFGYEPNLAWARPFSFHGKWEKTKWDDELENDRFTDWMKVLKRRALTSDTLILGAVLYLPNDQPNSEAADQALRQKVSKFHGIIRNTLLESGIPEIKIRIRQTKITRSPVAGFEPALYTCIYVPSANVPAMQNNQQEWSADDFAYLEKEKMPIQNLPVYFEQLHGKGVRIDTGNAEFQRIMELLMTRVDEGHPIRMLVESSASNLPTHEGFDNFYVADLRAKDCMKMIKAWLRDNGYDPEKISFDPPITLVQGPKYNLNHYLHSYYKQFQYIKLIPIYETTYNVKEVQLSPYMINFHFGEMDLVTDAQVLQTFSDKIAEVITRQGYIRMLIESSSSQVPVRGYTDNKILAWQKAEDAKQKIMEAVAKRGADPQRLIVTEERAIEQGPGYEGNYQTNPEQYEPYQYIKLIPEVLIRQ